MIVENAVSIFFRILTYFFNFFHWFEFPTFNLEAYMDEISGIMVFFEYAFYLFPLEPVFVCIGIVLALMVFRIVISLLRTIWEVIPWL